MTENKRFELAYEKGNWWAVRDGDITLWKEEVVGLLNKQHEQIQLLQVDKSDLSIDIEVQNEKINRLEEENEQLKSTIKEVTELLTDEVDVFSDKATEHDINAYMELKELDNKDAFYMAIATKKAIKMLKELEE